MSQDPCQASDPGKERGFDSIFSIRLSTPGSKIPKSDIPCQLRLDFNGGEWQGGIHVKLDGAEGFSEHPDVEFEDFDPKDDKNTTSLTVKMADQAFLLELKENSQKNGSRNFVVARGLAGAGPGPVDETDIWVAEEEDPDIRPIPAP